MRQRAVRRCFRVFCLHQHLSLGRAVPAEYDANALFGNAVDFGRMASAGNYYVFDDPQLDTAFTPPAPAPGSPLINAASSGVEYFDYWDRPRGLLADIGAVEHE